MTISCEKKRLVNILCAPVNTIQTPPPCELSVGDESLGVESECESEKSKCNDSDVKSCKKNKHPKNKGKTPKCPISSDFSESEHKTSASCSQPEHKTSESSEHHQSEHHQSEVKTSDTDEKKSESVEECHKKFTLTLTKSTDTNCPYILNIDGKSNIDNSIVLHLKKNSTYDFVYDLGSSDLCWTFSKSNVGGDYAKPINGVKTSCDKGHVLIHTKDLPKYSYLQLLNQLCGGILVITHY